MTGFSTIKAESLPALAAEGGVVLDVRTPQEHAEMRLCCSHFHAPLDTLDPAGFMAAQDMGTDTALYLLCRGGVRAAKAAEKFAAAGCTNVYVIEGGILACQGCGQPLEGDA